MTNKKLVVGNWKMNPDTEEEAKRLARTFRRAVAGMHRTDTVICPPYIYMSSVRPKEHVPHYHIGAQSVSFEESGSHTGEVSASMLKDAGVEFVIVGHSEMRAAGESDGSVARKTLAVLNAGMIPILCIGEKDRDETGSHYDSIKEQMKRSLQNIPASKCDDVIIAYEPVWAIGVSEAMKPEDIFEMSIFIKKVYADLFGTDVARKITVLYGGSVNSRNAADIIKIGQVDGLLVGRESVNATGFVELLKTVDFAD